MTAFNLVWFGPWHLSYRERERDLVEAERNVEVNNRIKSYAAAFLVKIPPSGVQNYTGMKKLLDDWHDVEKEVIKI